MIRLKKRPNFGFWGMTVAECLLGAAIMLLLHQLSSSASPNIQIIEMKILIVFVAGAVISLLILLVLAALWAVSKPKEQHREG